MFATILLPNFALQAAMRHEGLSSSTPVALIDTQTNKAVIIQLNQAAEKAGIRAGMSPSQALGRCLSLVAKARSPMKEESLANIILPYAFSLSPYVETTAPGVWTIQFTDNRNLFAKFSDLVNQLAECEVVAQVGIAPDPDASLLIAHLARSVLEVDNPKKYLAPLSASLLAITL